MKFKFSNGEATLSLHPVPMVVILTPHRAGNHEYWATQFLDCAAVGDDFVIGKMWPDEFDIPIDASEVKQFADFIRSKVTHHIGRFETVFIPNDPGDTF